MSVVCMACAVELSTPDVGETSSTCSVCAAGYGGSASDGGCVVCDGNMYKTSVGNAACSTCDDHADGCGGVSAGTCKSGYYGDADSVDGCISRSAVSSTVGISCTNDASI